jgi:hypothetical protein
MRTLLTLLVPLLLTAQTQEAVKGQYAKQEIRITMRDGKALFTSIYAPRDHTRTYPFLITRTPYGCGPYGADAYSTRFGPTRMIEAGYIFVCQDVRGRYMSEGFFEEMGPLKKARGEKESDESTDTWDTVEWLVKNFPGNNGKAGLKGTSYPGFYAAAGLVNTHPALVAVSPQAPMVDLFRGDDAFHNGAFYLAANFGFYRFFQEHKEPQTPSAERTAPFQFDTQDGYDFYLRLGPLANADEKYYRFSNRYWTDLLKHTSFDEYWQSRNLEAHIRGVRPAALIAGGWFDAEDLQGPLRLWRAVQSTGPVGPLTLVMGPWSHGGWNRGTGEGLGQVRFGSKTSEFFRDEIEFPFFEYHLKGQGRFEPPTAWLFETGRNQWHRLDAWPSPQAARKTLYFRAGGALSFDAPAEADAFDEYVSDPAKPVPFTSFITTGMAQTYMVDDQRHASARPDVLVYRTEPLAEDVSLGGPLTARLHVSTSGTDSDWVVKLIDVYPNDAPDSDSGTRMGGYQQLVRGEPFRGRFWRSFEKPEPLPAGRFVKIEYVLPDVYHTFLRGHRIMVQVQSSWFPLVDRNPQKFVPSIPYAKPEDFVKATQRVGRDSSRPSGVEVLVIQ